MKVISGDKFVYFDVDDTLINWDRRDTEASLVFKDSSGGYWSLEPKWEIIKRLKAHKKNGDTVVVWSQGGWDWAMEVCETLRIEEYVDVVLSKPHTYYDDLHCNEFMKDWYKVK